jgi:integrase
LDSFVLEHGHRSVAQLEPKHVEALIAEKASKPAAANKLRKLLSLLMREAIVQGWRQTNPVDAVRGVRVRSKGHRTWTDDEIATFQSFHPIGSEARLAFALLLYTGQRRSDVVRMGRQHVKDGVIEDGIITIAQKKGGEAVEVSIPILPKLAEVLNEVQARRITPTFVVGEHGGPYTEASFTNRFFQWRQAAGLPQGLTPHGLRKTFCRIAAESGMTPHEIMAISGHSTLKEVMRYTAAVDRLKLAMGGMEKVKQRTSIGNPTNGFPKAKS